VPAWRPARTVSETFSRPMLVVSHCFTSHACGRRGGACRACPPRACRARRPVPKHNLARRHAENPARSSMAAKGMPADSSSHSGRRCQNL
jgi:hypothetical protein